MFYLQFASLLCILFTVGATVASCLIPELTVMGIWGFPVLGFALIVGVIFRIAVYYDPRQMSPERTKKNAGYFAISLLCHLGLWSTLDRIFVEGRSSSAILCTIIGGLIISVTINIAESAWLVKMVPGGNTVPIICQIRAVVFYVASIVQLIGYLADKQDLILHLKPVVIFFAYANWVYFAAIYSGILHPQDVFASNGSIAERVKAWFRSIIEQGDVFFIIDIASLSLSMLMHVFVVVGDIPTKFHLLPKAFFAIVVGIMCYIASRCDPRKPPECSNCANRVVSLFVIFAVEIYLGLYMEFIIPKDDPYAFEVHSVTLIALLIVRVLLTIHLIFREIAVENRRMRKVIMNIVYTALYTLACVYFVLMNIVGPKFSLEYEVGRILASTFYYIATMSILTVIAGKYRKAVKLVSPTLVQAPPVIVVDNSLDSVNV
jgi:hypothetical protein